MAQTVARHPSRHPFAAGWVQLEFYRAPANREKPLLGWKKVWGLYSMRIFHGIDGMHRIFQSLIRQLTLPGVYGR